MSLRDKNGNKTRRRIVKSTTNNNIQELENKKQHVRSVSYPSIPSSIYYPDHQLKIQLILIGDRNVGKTCLLERFTDNVFYDNLTSTVGIDFKLKTVQVGDKVIRLQIWDTAGQERFNSITTAYYRGARGALIVYDVTRKETYTDIQRWLALLEEYGRNDVVVGIVSNKTDLNRSQVDPIKARKAAEEKGFMFFETSAKENSNIEHAFVCLISEILRRMPIPKNLQSNGVQGSTQNISKDKEKKFGCC